MMKTYTHNEFLLEKQLGKIQFNVDQYKNRTEVEDKLPSDYKLSTTAANALAIFMLMVALPMYLAFSWIPAVIFIAIGIGFFVYTKSFNYRVFVRASVKTDSEFYDYCVKNNVISIYEINRG